MSEHRITPAELDAWMRRASDDLVHQLDQQIDTEARLRELYERVAAESYADDSSPAGEVSDRRKEPDGEDL